MRSFSALQLRRLSLRPLTLRKKLALAALIAGCFVGSPSQSRAATIDWTGGTDTVWATGSNWTGGVAPANSLTTDIAQFNQATYTNQPNVAAAARSINGIIVGSASGAPVTITAAGTFATGLSIGGSGIDMSSAANNLTLGAATADSFTVAASQNWNVAGGRTLLGVGKVQLSTGFTLSNTGAGLTQITGVISGAGGLTQNGPGTMWLQQASNTYTGPTTVISGTLKASTGGGALGAGNLILSGGTLQLARDAGTTYNRPTTVNGDAQIITDLLNGTGAAVTHTLGTLSIGANILNVVGGNLPNSGTQGLTFGAVTLTGAATINVSPGTRPTLLTLASVANGGNLLTIGGTSNTTITGAISGAGGITKNDTSTLTLSGTNTYTGVTTINTGTLLATLAASLPGYTTLGKVNVVGGTLQVRAGSAGEFDSTGFSTLATNVIGNSGGIVQLNTTAGTTTLSTAFADPDLSFTKAGTGTLVVTTAQTYTGNTNINAGVVQVGVDNTFGTTGLVTIGAATFGSTNTTARSLSTPLAISGDTIFGDLTNNGALTFSSPTQVNLGGAARNLTFNTNVTWAGGYTGAPGYLNQKLGPGTLTLGGTTNQNDAFQLRDGVVIVDTGATANYTDAIRIQSAVTNGTARMEVRGTVNITTGGGNIRIGHDSSNNNTATNTLDVYGTVNLISYVAGGFTQLGSDSASAILNLHNGSSYKTRSITNATVDLGASVNKVNFDGGTLVAAETGATILNPMNGIGGGVFVQANGAKLDSNGFNVIVAAPLLHDPALGATPDGGLTKISAGRVSLTSDSTYTGPTLINAGELAVGAGTPTGSIPTASITNNGTLVLNRSDNFTFSNNITGTGGLTKEGANTATINGTNTYTGPTLISAGRLEIATPLTSDITVADGAALAGESSNTGTLTIGTSLGGSIVANASTPGFFQNNGQVTLVGNTTVTVTNPGPGTIVVLGSSLPIIGSAPTLGNLSDFRAGTNISFSGDNKQVLLNLVTANVTWVGGTAGFESVWDSNGVQNWNDGGVTNKFFAGDNATFNDTALNFTPTLAANVAPGSVTFNNSTNNYTLSGAGGITGDGTLTKQGTGTLVITTPNTYTGVTTISGGTLQLGDGVTNGTIGIGNIVNNANLTLNQITTDLTVNNLISGTGNFTSNGSTIITLNALNTYAGTTTINAGTVKMVTLSSLGTAAGGTVVGDAGRLLIGGTIPVNSTIAEALTLTGGPNNAQPDLQLTDSRTNTTLSGPVVVNGDATIQTDTGSSFIYTGGITTAGVLTLNAVGNQTVNSNISGAGGISKTGNGTLALNGAGSYPGGVNVSAGTLTVSTPTALGTGTLTLGNGVTLNNTLGAPLALTTNNPQVWNTNFIFTGTNDLNMGTGAVTLNSDMLVTTNGTGILTVGGVISGAFGLTKNNGGNLTLTAANTFTGKLGVANGTLEISQLGDAINGSTTIGLGNNANTVTLRYVGASNVVLSAARSIELGSVSGGSNAGTQRLENNGTGTLFFNGGVKVQATTDANQTFVLAGNNTGSNTIAGNITNGGDNTARTVILQKEGIGKWVLAGANTYGGATTIRSGIVEVSGSINNTANMNIGTAAGERGIVLLTGTGTLSMNNFQFGNTAATAAGALYQSGTTSLTQVAAASTTAFALGNSTGSYGYYKLSGGTATVNEAGIGAGNGGNGVMEVSGGTFTTNNFMTIGRGSNQAGILNISGGTVQMLSTSANLTAMNGGSGGLAVVNLSGGNLITATNRAISLNNNASGSNNTAVVNLSGTGILTTNLVTSGAATLGSGRLALLNFNGGTLRAQGTAPANFINILNDGLVSDTRSGTYLYSAGATIDTNAIDTTITSPLRAATGSGVTAATITIPLANRGAGYIGAPAVSLTGGGVGATAIANMEDDGTGNGTYRVVSLTITNPGLDYTSAPTVNWFDNTSVYTTQALAPVLTGANLSANVSGGLTKVGAGILTLTNANTYSGATTISAGTLQLGNGTTGNDGTISNSLSVVNNAALVYNRFGTATYGGIISGTGTVSAVGPGTQILTGTNTYAGGTTISAGTVQVGDGGSTGTLGSGSVTNNAALVVNRTGTLTTGTIDGTGTTSVTASGSTLTANHIRQSGLSIGAGSTVKVAANGGNAGTSVVTNLSINATGKLDLNDNDLVVDGGNLATLTSKLATGMDINGTYGNGPGGITSTAFATNPNFNTVLGIAANSELGYTSFSGQTVDANDVLIKYTYYGDADLNGLVDAATDFDLYITGLTSGGSFGGWLYGDFDYNGTVDAATDFDLYITGLTSQGAPLLTAGSGSPITAIPEPSTLVLAGLGVLGFAGMQLRRRRLAQQQA